MSHERITIRLPGSQVANMDALVSLGQYATRTEVVRAALREFFERQGQTAGETIQSAKGMQELQKLAALIKQAQGVLDDL